MDIKYCAVLNARAVVLLARKKYMCRQGRRTQLAFSWICAYMECEEAYNQWMWLDGN